HCWDRLELVAGVAEVVRRHTAMDWNEVRDAATRAGAGRILDLGLWLARDLVEVDLPRGAVGDDRGARALAQEVGARLLSEERDTLDWQQRVRFHLRARERLRDRLRYLVRLATTQT